MLFCRHFVYSGFVSILKLSLILLSSKEILVYYHKTENSLLSLFQGICDFSRTKYGPSLGCLVGLMGRLDKPGGLIAESPGPVAAMFV